MLERAFEISMIRFLPHRVIVLVKERPVQVVTCASIVLLWIILVLPAAFVNGLFTLDVGGVLHLAKDLQANLKWILSPYNGSGRYFPLYWLYHTLLFSLFGFDIRGYFLVLAGIFLLSALTTGILFARIVRDIRFTLLFSLSLFISSPNVESLYTFGKAEPAVYLFLSLILFLFYYRTVKRQGLSIADCVAISVTFACSMWFKETSIGMLAFPITGVAVTAFLNRSLWPPRPVTPAISRYTRLLICLVVGLGLSKLPFLIFADRTGRRSYTAFPLTWKIVADNIVFYFTQQPDVTILGIMALLFIVLVLRHALSGSSKLNDKDKADLIFVISLLTMAWAYLSAFLFWRWPMAYYIYLPAIAFRFVVGYGLYTVIRFDLCRRKALMSFYVAISLLFLHAVVYLWYTGSSQVTYSKVYTAALREYVSESHGGDSLIFESYPFYAEQVDCTENLVADMFHENRRLYGIADLVDPAVITPEMRQLLSITDADMANNEKNVPEIGDYVIAITGNELATWQVRGVGPYYSEGSFLQREGSYDMRRIAASRYYFPSAFFNIWNYHLETGQTYVGYELYKILAGPRFSWLGRYPDGWIGSSARLTLYPKYVGRSLIHISTSKYNPKNSVSVYQDDVLVDKVTLSEGKEHTFELKPIIRKTPTLFRFVVAKTFVPKQLHLNKDKRELGAFIRFEPFAPEGKQLNSKN